MFHDIWTVPPKNPLQPHPNPYSPKPFSTPKWWWLRVRTMKRYGEVPRVMAFNVGGMSPIKWWMLMGSRVCIFIAGFFVYWFPNRIDDNLITYYIIFIWYRSWIFHKKWNAKGSEMSTISKKSPLKRLKLCSINSYMQLQQGRHVRWIYWRRRTTLGNCCCRVAVQLMLSWWFLMHETWNPPSTNFLSHHTGAVGTAVSQVGGAVSKSKHTDLVANRSKCA